MGVIKGVEVGVELGIAEGVGLVIGVGVAVGVGPCPCNSNDPTSIRAVHNAIKSSAALVKQWRWRKVWIACVDRGAARK